MSEKRDLNDRVTMRPRTTAAKFAALACLTLASGCAEEPAAQQTLGQAELEKQIKDALVKKVGKVPKAIRCPGGIDKKQGAKTRCTLIASDDSKVGVTARVTSAEGDDADLFFKVDDEVRSGPKTIRQSAIEKEVKAKLEKSVGQVLEDVRCRGAMRARKGAKTRCTLIAQDGSRIGADVRFDRVKRKKAIFDIEVDDEPLK